MIIIGITGTLGAGKGTIVEYLVQKHGFIHFSVRNYITEVLKEKNLAINRDNMVLIANELRAKYNPAYIVEKLYEQANQIQKNCIIESIRTPGEAGLLKQKGNFFLFAADALPALRYERIVVRGSETDKISYDTFIKNEQREMNSDDPNKQNLKKCIEMADYVFLNNKDKNHLFAQVELVIEKILK